MQRVTSPHAWCKLAGSRYHEYWAGRLPHIQAQLQLAAAGERAVARRCPASPARTHDDGPAAGGLLAVAAGTAAGINLAGRKPAGGHGSGVPPACPTAQRSRSLAAAGSGGSSPGGRAPAAPTDVVGTALNQHTVRVTWADSATDITGFNVSNGCGTDGCSGGAINVRTGRVTATEVGTSILATTATGRLYLSVNDDSFSGNTGIWTVKIKIGSLP